MPDELWTEIRDIVQETRIRTIPQKKKYKKAKWLSEEALQIVVKRRDVKSKGEKKRYTHLNAEFQRIARRDKKDFLTEHCKEIEENNRMGKTRDLFKKIRDQFSSGFPGDSEDKASACNAGNPGLIPGSGRSLEKEMATRSSILARRIPWTAQSMGSQRIGHH